MSRASESNSSGSPSHSLIATAVRKARKGHERPRPLFQSRVPAEFPSPADDYVEASLDLSREPVGKEEAAFFVRVARDSMTEAGIHDDDILVVDRSVERQPDRSSPRALDGEPAVKRYEMRSGYPYLMPKAEEYDPIPIQDGQELVAQGVVQHVTCEAS